MNRQGKRATAAEGRSFSAGVSGLLNRLTPGQQLLGLLLIMALVAHYLFDYGQTSFAYLEQSSQRALAAFAIARGLNAAISLIQSAEVGLTLGISAALSPGEVLDPLNDLIERFSLVMLVASVALWVLRLCGGLLFEASMLWGMTLLFVSSLLLQRSALHWGVCIGYLLQAGTRLFLGLLLFAMMTPLVVEAVHSTGYVDGLYRTSHSELQQTRQQLELMSQEMEGSEQAGTDNACSDWTECLGVRFSRLTEALGGASRVGAQIRQFSEQAAEVAGDASRQVVIQIAIFLLETLLIPLLALLVIWRLLIRTG